MPLELKPGAPDVPADQPFGVAAAQRVDEKLMFVMTPRLPSVRTMSPSVLVVRPSSS